MKPCLLLLWSLILPVLPVVALSGEDDHAQSMLRHVVLFSWRTETPEAKIHEIEAAFSSLPGKIDTIHAFEWGTDVSVENLSQGYSHCFVVTFLTAEGRDIYLPHPDHQEFVELIKPHLGKVLVFDYWSR